MAFDKKDREQLDKRFEKQNRLLIKHLVPQLKTAVSLVVSQEITEQEIRFGKKLTEFKSEFFERVDPVLKEVMASREERTIIAHHIAELRARVEKIEKQLGISA